MTIKELKEAIKDLPDNMEIIIQDHYNGELREAHNPKTANLFKNENGFFKYEDKDKKEIKCFVLTQF